jgi:hypothetical protein
MTYLTAPLLHSRIFLKRRSHSKADNDDYKAKKRENRQLLFVNVVAFYSFATNFTVSDEKQV